MRSLAFLGLTLHVYGSDPFGSFVAQHSKAYESSEELKYRRDVFAANLEEIAQLRELNPHAHFAVNQHADLTKAEFRERFGGGLRLEQQGAAQGPVNKMDFAALDTAKIDWRAEGAVDPTVFDQGECGCCWAISVAQTVGSQYYLAKNLSTVPSLSFQQLICCDCKGDDAGCHGGDPHQAYGYIQQAGGLESSAAYPFTDGGPDAQSCNLSGDCGKCKYGADKVVASISGYRNVTWTDPASGNPGDENALAHALATIGPLSVCIDSDPWRFYTDGILDYGARKLNHCVQLVGYDSTGATPYWSLKNSWGESWGEKGYIRMKMGMDICGVADVATVPVI